MWAGPRGFWHQQSVAEVTGASAAHSWRGFQLLLGLLETLPLRSHMQRSQASKLQLNSNPIANSSCQVCEYLGHQPSRAFRWPQSRLLSEHNCMRDCKWELVQTTNRGWKMMINDCLKPLCFRVVSFAMIGIWSTLFSSEVICKLQKVGKKWLI